MVKYEDALKELEQIVARMENDEVGICLLYTSDAADEL